MGNYESPTIEQAGGSGNKIEPQIGVFVALTDVAVGLELAFYLAAAVFTHALAVVGPVVIMYVTWVKVVNHNS